MKIANRPYMAQSARNAKAVSSQEKVQTDKAAGKREISKADDMETFKKDFYKELLQLTPHGTVSNI